jgi:hypothetical protein
MDIGHLRHLRWAKSNQQNEWVAYNKMRGIFSSSMEGVIPAAAFQDTLACNTSGTAPASKPECRPGNTAVSAISLAQDRGQKTFVITSSNVAQALPRLNHNGQIKTDISNAVAAGKEVTIHESPVSSDGWTGAGYFVLDPQTGAGSYLIDGGANGGVFAALVTFSLLFPLVLLSSAAITPAVAAVSIGFAFLNVFRWASRIRVADTQQQFDQATAWAAANAIASSAFASVNAGTAGYIPEFAKVTFVRICAGMSAAIGFLVNLFSLG